jgi:hypothetical protein
MNLSTELLIGIVLIGLGLLLGAVAYMVLSSRGKEGADPIDEQEEAEAILEPDQDLPDLEEFEEAESSEDPASDQDDFDEKLIEAAPAEEPPLTTEPVLDEPGVDEQQNDLAQIESAPALDAPATEMTPPQPKPGPRIQVATLLRDEVSGELIIEVGTREYHSAAELRDSQDWIRVEYAASDLSKWIEMPLRRPAPEREMDTGEHYKPMSMIEQINEILQQKVAASGQDQLAVQLIEGQEGTARVLVGVHSYELGEVPDESISNLIREAVADWEAGQ